MVEDLINEIRHIPGDEPGVELQLINRRGRAHRHFSASRTLVLMHGATFPSASLFDVPIGGASFMDGLARAGFDVWAVDARGYGGSTRPPEMGLPPATGTPLVPARVAVRDLAAAVAFVRRHRGVARVNLLGMSWGGSVAGLYASRNNDVIDKLVLLAPLWLSAAPLRIDGGGSIPSYRLADVRAYEAAWRVAAPEAKRADLISGEDFEAWVAATLATDPAALHPGSIRAPAGAIADVREHWTAGRPLYDPTTITRPVLLMRAAWDVDVSRAMVADLFDRLTGAPIRRSVEIGEGTHMVQVERNRGQVLDVVVGFLREPGGPQAADENG